MFKYSAKDSLLVIVSLTQVILLAAPAWVFDDLSWAEIAMIGFAQSFLYAMNYQCTGHNFLHNPFFTSKYMNRAFSLINTIALGASQTMYKYHHLNHHTFNNDIPTKYGETRDRSSIYRWSKSVGKEEGIISYSLLGIFRSELHHIWKDTVKKREGWLAGCENVVLILFVAFLFWVNVSYGVFYVFIWYIGQSLALAENYQEHKGAPNTCRLDNSVSAYASWYNAIWFNNGYHQEHHFRPQVHWTEIPKIQNEMLPDNKRKIVHCHWFNV